MKHWSYDEETAKRESAIKRGAQRRVKEIFGAALLVAVGGAAGLNPRTVLEIADQADSDKEVRSPRVSEKQAREIAWLDDLLG